MGKVGWHAVCTPTHTWWSTLLSRRNALIMVVVYLAVTSVNDLTLVASRVIFWASAWNRPVLSAVMMVCLTWTWHGQAQRLWASTCVLMHRHALHPCPATYGGWARKSCDQSFRCVSSGVVTSMAYRLPYIPTPNLGSINFVTIP